MKIETIANALGYTWLDDSMTVLLSGTIERGKNYLKRFDPEAKFEDESEFASFLLIEYCRYALSNAIDDFGNNYASDIMSFHHAYLVRTNQEGEESAETEDET